MNGSVHEKPMTMTLNFKKALTLALLSPTALQAKDNYCLLKTPNDLHKKCVLGTHGNDTMNPVKNLAVHSFFWNRKSVTVTTGDEKKTLRKNDLYGYTTTAGTAYRFYNDDEFEIVATGDVCIYRQYRLTPNGKSYHREAFYFFSGTPDANISILNPANLSKTTLSEARITELLAQYGEHGVVAVCATEQEQQKHLQVHTK